MSVLTPEVVDLLMNLSCPMEEKTALMKALVRAGQAFTPPSTTNGTTDERERLRNANTKAERKRAADRERMAAKREAERVAKEVARLSQPGNDSKINGVAQVARDVAATVARDARDVASDADATSSDPRARVRDNNPKLVTTGSSVSASSSEREPDFDWPDVWPPSRAYLDALESLLRETAGEALNAAAPKLAIVAPILALGRSGRGPRCELQLDVLPAIRACAAKVRPGSVVGWDFFRPAIVEARDKRLAAGDAPEVGAVIPFRGVGPPRKSREDENREAWDYAIARIAQDEQ